MVSRKKTPKIDYEYQALGLEMQEFFPRFVKNTKGEDVDQWKRIWTLFWKVGYTERKIRYAFKECVTRGKPSVSYLEAIIRKCKL